MKNYRAEFEDDGVEYFVAESNEEAEAITQSFQEEHGLVFNLDLMDHDNNVVKSLI